ncbi:Uncharacterised protein [Mycobacterium tuberculosis]|nr:Uncharacterised protein [Mycobacterium tuberculosis]CNV65820.1 Uncharacterised protein [Mycobacterium tuberculosis]COW78123.1 Uncharacterised protein [Mycobacterium tuberculosis]
MPVDGDRSLAGKEDVRAVRPFVDGVVEPVEVRPPERLVLAAMIAAGSGQQGDRCLFRRALAGGGIAGELGQYRRQRVTVVDRVGVRNWLSANGCDAGFPGAHEQPVTQRAGGPAVVVVVAFDLFEHGCRLIDAAGRAQFAVPGIGVDRVGGGGDVAGAWLRPEVQRLQRLQAERVGAHPNALAYQRV